MELEERVGELERRIEEMFVRGVILESDPVNKRVVVSYGTTEKPMKTGWLPVKPIRAGKAIVWWWPEVGEGVTVLSPGDLRFGEVYPGSYHKERPAPSDDPDLFLVDFGDGSKVSHHRGTGKLDVINVGEIEITTSKNATVNAKDVTVNAKGKVAVNSDAKDIAFNGGDGVVTGAHICQFTGNPHSDCSAQVKAGK